MDGINALIAEGGGHRAPMFDYQVARGNALRQQSQEMRLRELALDIKTRAMQVPDPAKPISLDYDWGTISGDSQKVAMVADAVARFPDQIKDPGFMPWVAQQGVTWKAKEIKSPEAPKTRTRQEGSQEITEEWTGTGWKKIGGGPKWNPDRAGMKVYDKDGNLIVDTGGGGPVSKPTQTKIEGEIISGKEQLARMNAIQAEFKPEYLETGTRLSAAWTGIKAKLGKDVAPEDAKQLADFKKFQRRAIENINKYIKEFTGAQMSEQEANRLRLAQPDPGESWWQGDDPITFKAKMDDVVKASRAAVARWEYYKARGLSDAEIKGVIKSDSGISLEKLMTSME